MTLRDTRSLLFGRKNTGGSRTETIGKLVQRLRAYQVHNQFVEADEGPLALSRAEVTVMIEFDTGADLVQSELAKELRIDPTLLRRTLKGLVERKFLIPVDYSSDRRRNKLKLTSLGHEALQLADRNFDQNTRRALTLMSATEQKHFGRMFSTLARGLGQQPARVRPHEEPVRGPMREATRALELVGTTPFFVSEVSALEWHVLNDLNEGLNPLAARDLVKRYGIPKNTLSRSLSLLADRGYIARKASDFDKREAPLVLTNEGRRFVRSQLARITKRIAEGLQGVATADIEHFSSLLGRSTDEIAETSDLVLRQEAVLHLVRSQPERSECLEFAVKHSVTQGKSDTINHAVMFESRHSFMLKEGGTLTGVGEIRTAKKHSEFINLVTVSSVTDDLLVSFVLGAVELYRQSSGATKIVCVLELIPVTCRKKIFSEILNGVRGIIR